jgi:hypothetical protein
MSLNINAKNNAQAVFYKIKVLGLLILFSYAIGLGLLQIFSSPIWDFRDEIAHFDYIEKLSHFHYPIPNEDISSYTAELCRYHFRWNETLSYDGTISSMGLAGKSYEAQQPPVYYVLLAIPYSVTKIFNWSPEAKLRTLRLIGYIFYVVGALLVIAIFSELARSFNIAQYYGYWIAFLILIINKQYVTTLGNDNLSLLLSSLSLYTALLYWRTKTTFSLIVLSISCGMSAITKLTNLPLILLPLITLLFTQFYFQRRAIVSHWIIALFALLPVNIYFVYQFTTTGHILGLSEMRELFASIVKPFESIDFIKRLVTDSLHIQDITTRQNRNIIFTVIVILLIWNLIQNIYNLKNEKATAILYFFTLTIGILIITIGLLLNHYAHGVYWSTFRHYYAALPLWVFIFAAAPIQYLHSHFKLDRN